MTKWGEIYSHETVNKRCISKISYLYSIYFSSISLKCCITNYLFLNIKIIEKYLNYAELVIKKIAQHIFFKYLCLMAKYKKKNSEKLCSLIYKKKNRSLDINLCLCGVWFNSIYCNTRSTRCFQYCIQKGIYKSLAEALWPRWTELIL